MEYYLNEFCGIPSWLMREYLVEVGGEETTDGRIVGDGWTAKVTKIEPFQKGRLSVGQIRVEIEGEPESMSLLMALLEPKMIRAGG